MASKVCASAVPLPWRGRTHTRLGCASMRATSVLNSKRQPSACERKSAPAIQEFAKIAEARKLLIDEVYPSRNTTLMHVLVGGILAVSVASAVMSAVAWTKSTE